MLLRRSLLSTLPLLSAFWAAANAAATPRACQPRSGNATSTASPAGSTNSPGGTSTNNSASAGPGAMVASTWYTSWHSQYLPVEDISWSKYSSIAYAFGLSAADATVSLLKQDTILLPQLVEVAHKNKVNVSLSIGGWTGSRFFSPVMEKDESRATFLKSVLDVVDKYKLDGIDFDWEYPNDKNGAGLSCNERIAAADDSANFLELLKSIRASDKGKSITLSAAVAIRPFLGVDGSPLSDVSDFAKVLDYVAIMNYDLFSGAPTGGPNAPLDDSCAPDGHNQSGSATSALAAWTAAKFPAGQIVLGVPAYGHSLTVKTADAVMKDGMTLAMYPPVDKGAKKPQGDAWDTQPGSNEVVCEETVGASGVWNFRNLVNATGGLLEQDGVQRMFDDCSQTPVLWKEGSGDEGVMLWYDDERSFKAKGGFIKEHGLRGFAMWEAAGDVDDKLVNAIRDGMKG